MISIVIPLYNKEKQIENTLQSVFNQTFQDFEIIVVNDGSTDKSVDIVKQFTDSRIRLIEQKNQGVSVARNTGIKEAKYDYIALLDADDEWKPTYLETQIDLIHSFPECSVFACAYEFRKGDKITPVILNKIPFQEDKGILSNYFEVASCSHPPICSSNVIVRKEAFRAIGGFPVGIKSGEDLLTWARLAVNYQIAYEKKVQFTFQKLSGNAIELSSQIRSAEEPDIVGTKLKELLVKRNDKHCRYYLSAWYKMRSNLYYRDKKRIRSGQYAIKAIWYNPFNYKNWGYLIFTFLPRKIVAKFMGR